MICYSLLKTQIKNIYENILTVTVLSVQLMSSSLDISKVHY